MKGKRMKLGWLFVVGILCLSLWPGNAAADVQVWLQPVEDNTVQVWMRSKEAPRAFSQVTIALKVGIEPIETTYHLSAAFKIEPRTPEGMIARWWVPPMTGRWADEPPVAWKVRTNKQIFALVVTDADLGKLALNYTLSRVWRLEGVTDGVGTWVDAGWKDHVWEATYLGEAPLLLMSLKFASDPGEITFVWETPEGYPCARTLVFLKYYHTRWGGIVDCEVIEPPAAPADTDMFAQALRGVRMLLLNEPSQKDEALALINETIGDDE